MNLTRRQTLAFAAAASLTSALPAFAADGDQVDIAKLMSPTGWTDHVMGNKEAKVTFIEYLSPTCPHCARFALEVYPDVKTKYVDTNLIAFLPRPFVRNVLDAVVFMLADASGEANFLNVVDTFFKTQNDWAVSEKPKDAILAIAKQLGFTEDSFNKALTNQDLFNGMDALRNQALTDFGLTGTPTFYINGKTLSGEKTIDDLSKEIDPLLG